MHGTVLVTREETASGPLSRALIARGFRVRSLPLLASQPPDDPEPLRRAIARINEFDWVVVTSARGANALLAAMADDGEADRPRLAVVGMGTGRPLRVAGWPPTITGAGGGVELISRMREHAGDLTGMRILLPTSDRARAETATALEEAGAEVAVVTAYRTAEAPGAADELRALLEAAPPDAAAFTSPSAVEVFAKAAAGVPEDHLPRFAAIGSTTAAALASHGWDDPIVPASPGLDSLAEALAQALAIKR